MNVGLLLLPLLVAGLVGTMIVAASTSAANGLWAHLGGCEVPVVYAGPDPPARTPGAPPTAF